MKDFKQGSDLNTFLFKKFHPSATIEDTLSNMLLKAGREDKRC